jgi:structural maintenance of chromosome 4
MASISPTRPTRRAAAARKRIVVEESDDEESNVGVKLEAQDNDDGEDFTPAPLRSPRRTTRRKTTDVPSTPRTAARQRKAKSGDVMEPSVLFDPEASMAPEPMSPTKRGSPRKRKSAAPTRKTRGASISEPPPLPTPSPSVTPEPSQPPGTPLKDITNTTINEDATPKASQKNFVEVKAMDTVLEKPMDIVIRTRALGIPQSQEPVGPRSRTVIKYLVLINFKSYAGRQEVGPFDASFSSVVGPNGSGKSNVIDSLLFVFGFRASKMRQGKISALIHNSAAFPDLDFCEVEVHFEEVMDLVCGNKLDLAEKC